MLDMQQAALRGIQVRPIRLEERPRWRALMREHHYLGYAGLVGEQVAYVATLGERWVALLAWSAAALKISPRDRWIGWSEWAKFNRSKFVVNNARFLLLPGERIPNLASRVLGLNLRRLSRDYSAFYGHPVFLAETFVETARFRGTCYLAAGWKEIGETRGFSRKGQGYVVNGARKKILVKPLCRDALQRLSDPFHDPIHPKERILMIDYKKFPLEGRGGLVDVLKRVPDPRSIYGTRHSFISILAISVCAILSGARSYEAIAEWAKKLSLAERKKFRCRLPEPPSESCIRKTLQRIDSLELDTLLYSWLSKQSGFEALGAAIAIDGKTVRGSHDGDRKAIHLLSAFLHEQAVTIGQVSVDEKTNEIPALKNLLNPMQIEGAIITADAMHTQSESSRFIVKDKNADYLFTVKENQPTLRKQLEDCLGDRAFSPSGPKLSHSDGERPWSDRNAHDHRDASRAEGVLTALCGAKLPD